MPTLGVSMLVIDANRVLLIRRSDLPLWCLPGGAVEPAESLEEAAIRETREETSLSVALDGLVGLYSRPRWTQGGDHEAVFVSTRTGGVPAPRDGEALELRYFGRDELPASLFCCHLQYVLDGLDGRRGLVASSDVRWPFPELSFREVVDGYAAGRLTEAEVVQAFGLGQEVSWTFRPEAAP